MDITQQGVVTLLRSAITGEKLLLPEEFDLETAYPELKKHHMDALLYDGAVRCGISKKLPVMQELFQKYCRALLTSEGQMRQLERIFAAFEANGIDYMPLKGSKMKALYPKPELRYMGDADILIRTEQYQQIASVMKALEFSLKEETDHEIIWYNKELLVELHKHLIPSYNKDYYCYFESGWQRAYLDKGHRYTMKSEDEWLFQFTHFAKHFRDGGIGCRYVVDLWVYLRQNLQMNQEYLRRALEQLQLTEFYENILRLIDAWFQSGSVNEKTELINDFVFASGSWGDADSKVISQALRAAKGDVSQKNGKIAYIRNLLFPNVKMLEGKYTVLKKAPWMLPVVWAYRPIYKLLHEKGDFAKKRQDLAVLTEDKLQMYQNFMHLVGLDYHL